jgi:acyl dehydratase
LARDQSERTDDRQWIHVDPVRAADGPYGSTIAHGLLTLSLLPMFMHDLYRVDNVTMAINYGFNKPPPGIMMSTCPW